MSHAPAYHSHPVEQQEDRRVRKSWALLGVRTSSTPLFRRSVGRLHLAGGDLQWPVTAYLMMSGGGQFGSGSVCGS